jgi:GNAT superfamily N-acetyltransferase
MSNSNITIRVAEEADGSAVSKIWVDGLLQTVEHSWRMFQPLIRWAFDKMAEEALSEEGDIGPNGTRLIQNWVEPPDRTFLVAVDDGVVVGCVGVKKKSRENELDVRKEVTDDTKVAAIYRLSVDASARRKGIARKLMDRAHEWAKEEQGCESMWLNSANPRGLDFYKAIGYEPCHWTGFQMSKNL